MKKIAVVILSVSIFIIGCAGAPPKPLNQKECKQLRVNSHYYWNNYGCKTEQISGERASIVDCQASADKQTEDMFSQCMAGEGVLTTVKTFYKSQDLTKSAVGAIAGMVTGFGMGSQHTIEVFHLNDHPVVAQK